MKYMSTTEAAALWGISRKTVNNLARTNQIPGAKLVGNRWMIPSDTPPHVDRRTHAYRESESFTNGSFHYPMYLYRDFFYIKERLSDPEELELYSAFECTASLDYEAAYHCFQKIADETNCIYIRITALYMSAHLSIFLSRFPDFLSNMQEMKKIFSQDFEHRKDMEYLLVDIETEYNGNAGLLNFELDSNYNYSPEVIPHLTVLELYRELLLHLKNGRTINTNIYEIKCNEFRREEYIYPLIKVHVYLAIAYAINRKHEDAFNHILKSYNLSIQYRAISLFSESFGFMPHYFSHALDSFDIHLPDNTISELNDYWKSRSGLVRYFNNDESYPEMMEDDIELMIYAIENFSTSEIAEITALSKQSIDDKYASIMSRFNCSDRAAAAELFRNIATA